MAGAIRYLLIGLGIWVGIAKTLAVEVVRYSEFGGDYALGYAVPRPVSSLTPVDGFRSYESLHARHQSLMFFNGRVSGSVVSRTTRGRPIWAYQLSDRNSRTITGFPEPALLVTGTVHAREWSTAEVATAIIEHLADNARDQGVHQYLLENTNMIVVPVVNVDGFILTQRFPKAAIVDQNPAVPRDGRLRRKNMRGVDRRLKTFGDYLLGTDINRQWYPAWASSTHSSSNPESIVYHGMGPMSEPESQALLSAAALGPEHRLRLYIDIHSFGRVFFVPKTYNERHNSLTESLVGKLARQLSAVGEFYRVEFIDRNDYAGATDEYHVATYEIPSFTLETEPGIAGGADYEGFGAPSDGFILPESEIARVREQITQTTILASYHQAGPPAVRKVRVYNRKNGHLVYSAVWKRKTPKTQTLKVQRNRSLRVGGAYTLWVAFDKPMRWRHKGVVANHPGQSTVLAPRVRLGRPDFRVPINGKDAIWLEKPGPGPRGFLRYRDDAFSLDFDMPVFARMPRTMRLRLRVSVSDFAELALDADPSTRADWRWGAWSNYESKVGVAGASGGTDATISLRVSKRRVAERTIPIGAASPLDVALTTRGQGPTRGLCVQSDREPCPRERDGP